MQRLYIYRSGQPKGHMVTPAAYPLWSGMPMTPEEPPRHELPLEALAFVEPDQTSSDEMGTHH